MRRATIASILSLPLMLPTAILASEPLPMATVDYAVTYALTGSTRGGMTYRHAAARGQVLMQMTLDGQAATILLDPKTGAARMWGAGMPGMVARFDAAPSDKPRGTRTSDTATHAGERCTIWRVDKSRVCLAADGVPIAFEAEGSRATATRVERTVQPAQLFTPPPGQEMRMPGVALPLPF
jgi:hypothetical protein